MAVELGPIESQLADLERQIKSPTPTPPVGTLVIWYDRAQVRPGAEIAAMVTGVEAPGKLKLVAFRPQGMPEHKRGVLHVSDPVHDQRHNAVSRNSGAWSYPEGITPSSDHFSRHLEVLRSRRDSVKKSLVEARGIAESNKVSSGK